MRSKPLRQNRTDATWVVSLVCAILLLAQVALELHQIDHFAHPHEGVCELCAMGVGSAPMPAMAPRVAVVRLLVSIRSPRPDPLIRDGRVRRAHFARAPPNYLLIA
ncbi:hypothetical protein G3480_22690 [Thiorhodococcus mannitoliphagus]|uniref:DUF2607 family protein n=1 Tax=Thiorhodococcus mannitoliphagus TaxID=329406 RepID=A0A6P1DZZ0_9GAMM|nr:hypothetical protein [Thiorhodococcus mannitoliphagus]NEX23070.1 hypothetical protein [Thiorhodococcus mannitoliphagus]